MLDLSLLNPRAVQVGDLVDRLERLDPASIRVIHSTTVFSTGKPLVLCIYTTESDAWFLVTLGGVVMRKIAFHQGDYGPCYRAARDAYEKLAKGGGRP